MRWQLLILVFLGVVAAICAAVLVAAVQAGLNTKDVAETIVPEIEIVVAERDLAATQIVDADAIRLVSISPDQAPPGHLTNPVQAVGKVLAVPMVAGQPFNQGSFAKEGSGLHLASVLPDGMCAMGIELSGDSGLAGLLYPGSLVDVLVTFQGRSPDETHTKTLFQRIQVLSIEEMSIVNPDGQGAGRGGVSGNRRHVVTLMLDHPQAERLQAAMRHGMVALALRNPMDQTKSDHILAAEEKPAPVWEMTILRGGKSETKRFPLTRESDD